MEGTTITTHYDFNSMHDILVKLDCLGHDDPTMMHRLEELTGVNFREIPLDDRKVMSLFSSPEALGVTQEQIMWETGTLGIPEFGTSFVRGMLMETRPTTMEELIRHLRPLARNGRVAGQRAGHHQFRHGQAGSVLLYPRRHHELPDLQGHAGEDELRHHGKRAQGPRTQTEGGGMREHDVPQWAIDSCHKIKYSSRADTP